MTVRKIFWALNGIILILLLALGGLVVQYFPSDSAGRLPVLIICALLILGNLGLGFLLEGRVFSGLSSLLDITRKLALGELDVPLDVGARGEFAQIMAAFSQMVTYFKHMAGAAEAISAGDLSVEVAPLSAQDVLGNAFERMVINLRKVIQQVSQSANQVRLASEGMRRAASEAERVASQMMTTSDQVATGVTQQTEDISRTADAIEQINRSILGVAKGAQEQTQAVTRTYETTQQLSSAVEEVRRGALEQVEQMRQAEKSLNNLAGGQGRVAQLSGEAFIEAGKASTTAADGNLIISEAVQGIQQVKVAAEELAGRVLDLGKRSAQIESVIVVIAEIASNTNLLALNAAIEAARAGHQGKGFSVVAEEVRRLAIRTSRATEEIKKMIEGMRATASEVSGAMEQAGANVENSVQLTNQAGQAFEAIVGATQGLADRIGAIQEAVKFNKNAGMEVRSVVAENIKVAGRNQQASEEMSRLNLTVLENLDTVSAIVEENTATTEEISSRSSEVSHSVENAASISEQNSASMEEMSASARELNTQAQDVLASANAMAEMAKRLNELVARFNLG
jgi:methyl-accepting chemotaxis protein